MQPLMHKRNIADSLDVSEKNNHNMNDELCLYANQGKETLLIYIDTRLSIYYGMFLLHLILITAVYYFAPTQNEFILTAAILLSSAFLVVSFAIHTWRKSKRPLVILTEKGITFLGMKKSILWLDINDININLLSSQCVIHFFLKQEYEPPSFVTGSGAFYDKTQHTVCFFCYAIKNMRLDDFCEKTFIYWRADNARHQLSLLD